MNLIRLLPSERHRPEELPSTFERVLVVRQHNQLGDMLCAVPLLRALRARYPKAHLALLTSPVNHEVMVGLRYLDEIIDFDKRTFARRGAVHPFRTAAFVRDLRKRRFDLALVPSTVSTSFTSDLLAYLSGARVRIGAGSLEGRENPSAHLYTLAVDLDWRKLPHRHQTLRNLDVASPLGIETADLAHEMMLGAEDLSAARAWLTAEHPHGSRLIGFHPGAGKVANRWPADRFAEVANRLCSELEAGAIVTCGPMDEEPVAAMLRSLSVPHSVVRNRPIRSVAAILAHLELVVTNDTGVMHVAAAAGAPVLSLFGPTDPEQWAPIGSRSHWIAGEGGAIDSIAVDRVVAAAREILAGENTVSRGFEPLAR